MYVNVLILSVSGSTTTKNYYVLFMVILYYNHVGVTCGMMYQTSYLCGDGYNLYVTEEGPGG